jgi:hypothetical protein
MGAADELKGSQFRALEKQDKGFALLLGLLALGVIVAASSGDPGPPDYASPQGCATTFGTFQQSCDHISDVGWAAIQLGIW